MARDTLAPGTADTPSSPLHLRWLSAAAATRVSSGVQVTLVHSCARNRTSVQLPETDQSPFCGSLVTGASQQTLSTVIDTVVIMSSGATPQLLKVYMAQAPGSVGVDEFQLRKQTTLDRVWHWLTRRSVPVVGSWQHTLAKCMDATLYSVFVVTVTLLALFLVDVSVVSAHYTATLDTTVGAIIFACFLFFLLEILAAVCVQDDYFLSFFFLCDFVGTLRSVDSRVAPAAAASVLEPHSSHALLYSACLLPPV